jgi:hypothetical protein
MFGDLPGGGKQPDGIHQMELTPNGHSHRGKMIHIDGTQGHRAERNSVARRQNKRARKPLQAERKSLKHTSKPWSP